MRSRDRKVKLVTLNTLRTQNLENWKCYLATIYYYRALL